MKSHTSTRAAPRHAPAKGQAKPLSSEQHRAKVKAAYASIKRDYKQLFAKLAK